MSEKRRDNKRRVLRNGESQRSDGRYAYKYIGKDGKPHFVYSWRLEKTDLLPSGKRECEALREQEKRIVKELERLTPALDISDLTVAELTERYINSNATLRPQTIRTYRMELATLRKYPLSNKKVCQTSTADVKDYALELSKTLSYGSVGTYLIPIKAAFADAIENDELSYNPCMFKLHKLIPNNTIPKTAIQEQSVKALLDFCKIDKGSRKNFAPLTILFGTGMRISELSGLTFADVDFNKKIIEVRHQLIYLDNEPLLTKPKTSAGVRIIPMSEDVIRAFREVIADREAPKDEKYRDLIFLSREGSPMHSNNWRSRFASCVKRMEEASVRYSPEQLTPHLCRHTFCSDMAIKGINLKVLQSIMGHSSLQITTDRYSHITSSEDIVKAFHKVNK